MINEDCSSAIALSGENAFDLPDEARGWGFHLVDGNAIARASDRAKASDAVRGTSSAPRATGCAAILATWTHGCVDARKVRWDDATFGHPAQARERKMTELLMDCQQCCLFRRQIIRGDARRMDGSVTKVNAYGNVGGILRVGVVVAR